jgi:[ribosomal protein S5]-alanine N-acetyltransferase
VELRPPEISTARLRLVVLRPGEIRSLIAGDTRSASVAAGVGFPDGWPPDLDARHGLPLHLEQLEASDAQRAWRIRVVVERATSAVIGACNLKGPPDADGDVEIGWAILESRRRHGYATEAAAAVVAWAFGQAGVKTVSAAIADDNVPSQRVATRLQLTRTERLRRGRPLWSRSRSGCPS